MATEYTAIMEQRAGFYNLLRRFYHKEVSPEFMAQLKKLPLPENCGSENLQAGYDLLRCALAQDISLDDLAADYAKVFLAAGENQGKGAFPYESVYTSRQGLVMQQAWEDVKAIYSSDGLGLGDVPSDLMEDHLAIELHYMAMLCMKSAEKKEGSELKKQLSFLDEHLLNWVGNFCGDVEKYARTDFYKAAAKMTLGFLSMDREMLLYLLDEGSGDNELSCRATAGELDALFDGLKDKYRVFAPKATGRHSADGSDTVRYGEISRVEEIVWDRQSDFSAKEIYYPIVQTMFYFTENASTESRLEDQRDILIFARPCDINAMRRLDTIFLKNGDEDIYYAQLRNKVKMVMMDCGSGFENCACVSMGSNIATDYAMAVRPRDGGFEIQVKDGSLASLFSTFEKSDFAPEFVTANKRSVALPVINGIDDLKAAANLPMWKEYNDKCVGCGGCNTVCPTCSCFDTVDVIYHETSRDGERRRIWSSCMLDTFTQTAGGRRERTTPGENMRFKVLHKVYDYQKRFGTGETMCVGCGRCVTRCPKDIDYINTVNTLAAELEKARKEVR